MQDDEQRVFRPEPAAVAPQRRTADGLAFPAIGLGSLEARGSDGVAAVTSALGLGYRLLDTAFIYDNEGTVGRALRTAPVPRDDVVFSTKLPGRAHSADLALQYVEESLFRSGLDHLDLVLIHWPNPRVGLYTEAWRALVEARERGLTRMIGVSNFLPDHLDRLIDETGVAPAVNQIEVHPYFPQLDLQAENARRGILTEGWSPLGRGTDLLEHPVVRRIAEAHAVSPAQIVLAWSVTLGVIPLPRAADPSWQAENLDVFAIQLSEDEVAALSGLARPDGRVSGQDPRTHEEF
ncbi:aldo/keto reductase [Curtobacterium sp. MCBD17_028]|uniref:aldo/keto reductase n=1 Tax=Curtobacterium sp. MCBD17_028 TaxID=2175670 RepID=UPI000DAA6DD1|nr:aldo/keto reductase [Curtobacterium sp. MCBD17_028]PZE24350.1 aldo/keto reductase [Curtobacterium sp. MCBD17_028]